MYVALVMKESTTKKTRKKQKKLQQIQTFLLFRTANMAIGCIDTVQVRGECSAPESWLCM